jgi:hypothetical protein
LLDKILRDVNQGSSHITPVEKELISSEGFDVAYGIVMEVAGSEQLLMNSH